ncbi:MAG: SPASM domain-containing protein [Actinobacteria bacterium]|nr:SPASM domain-containing protein [Actinomycetota bacterium]
MDNNVFGLININIELTNRCNKNCWMCGRRKIDREYPELALKYGDMDFELVKKISEQVPPGIVVQLHNNGEPLLYPYFGKALDLFKKNITNIVTNGKLLVQKADEIIDKLDTLSISVFENDEESKEQYRIIEKFLKIKGSKKPFTSLRLIGEVDDKKYKELNILIIRRVLHSPLGSFNYKKLKPTIPEIGICLDFLNHLAINKNGDVSICVRLDPKKLGVIGNINDRALLEIWNDKKRLEWKNYHILGQRNKVPLCSFCHYWGVPTGFDLADTKNNI